MGYQGKVKGRRQPPYPNSILDRKALTEALEEAGIPIKRIHIDAFYQALHRQHYPPLAEFVENYYSNERKEYLKKHTDDQENRQQQPEKPLKNAVTSRKNRNKKQLPRAFLEYIATTPNFVNCTSRVKEALTSQDKSTTKLIVELYDGFVVESVLMRYDQKGSGRASLCVSSQCGCAMGCTFCATGTMGLSGNLTTGEILEQLVHAGRILGDEYTQQKDEPGKNKIGLVRNVVFMGMGEPLDNYTNVTEACRAMIDRGRWNLRHGRVTVSTVGLISQIRRLTKELPEVSLALSLHAPNQEARTAIVPTASRYPIEGLINALDNHMMIYVKQRREQNNETTPKNQDEDQNEEQSEEKYTEEERIKESSRRRAMIEYVMLEGESSSFECAHQLGKLCENRHLLVNLIPYNQTDVEDELRCPSVEHMQQFRDIVASYGTFCTIRRTMGADIASACGQLVQKKENEKEREKQITTDIEDTIPARIRTDDAGAETRKSQDIAGEPSVKDASDYNNKHAVTNNDSNQTSSSWMDSASMEDLDRLSNLLFLAASASATCFLASSIFFLKNKR
jgi:sorting nexin-8